MIIDAALVLKKTDGNETLATSATTGVNSDYIDFGTENWQGTGRPLTLLFNVVSNTASGGTDFTFTIEDCDTANGTYATIATRTITLAALTVGTQWEMLVPFNTRRYVRFKITPVGTGMTGALGVKAALVNK